jgi:hypothetical protein
MLRIQRAYQYQTYKDCRYGLKSTTEDAIINSQMTEAIKMCATYRSPALLVLHPIVCTGASTLPSIVPLTGMRKLI